MLTLNVSQCSKSGIKHFKCVIFSPQDNPTRWSLLLSPLYRWASWGPERWSDMPRVHTKPALCQTWAPLLSHLSQGCIPLSLCSFIWGKSTLLSCFSIMARQEQEGEARAGQCGSVFSWLAQLIFWSFLLHCFGSKKQGLLRVAFQQAECLVENLFTPCLCFYSPIQPPLLFPLVCKPWALVQKLLAQLSGRKAFSAIYLTTGFEFLLSVCLTV